MGIHGGQIPLRRSEYCHRPQYLSPPVSPDIGSMHQCEPEYVSRHRGWVPNDHSTGDPMAQLGQGLSGSLCWMSVAA